MLSHSVVEWDVIILHPASKRMEEKDWVLVSHLDQLLPSVLQQEAMSVMEWVSHLEGINGISSSLLSNIVDLLRGKSVLVHTISKFDVLGKSH